jgi:hypothetical protein
MDVATGMDIFVLIFQGIKPSSEYEEPSLQDLLNSCLIGQNIDLVSGASEDNIHVYKPGTPKKVNNVFLFYSKFAKYRNYKYYKIHLTFNGPN